MSHACSYESPEIALNCGMMLRECIRHESLCKIVLYSEEFYNFFGFVEVSTFDIASDAFATFKVRIFLTRNREGEQMILFALFSLGSLDQTQSFSSSISGAKL